MSSTHVVEFENVCKDYPTGLVRRRTVHALSEVNLQIKRGEVLALVGPNRAGKTTLLKTLLSLCRPSTGRILRFGRPAVDRRTLSRVGYVHENQAFPRYLTAAALLEHYGALALAPYDAVRRRVGDLLDLVGLAERAHEPIARFSKGMTQRLAVAQALINEPDLLVLDEPGEGLDLPGRRLMRELILDQRRRGKTALLVSHLLTEVEAVCDRVAVLVGGRLVSVSPLADLIRDPATGCPRPLEAGLQDFYENKTS